MSTGLACCPAHGRFGGRKPKMDAPKLDAAKKLLRAGTPVTEEAKTLGVGRATLYRKLNSDKQTERAGPPQLSAEQEHLYRGFEMGEAFWEQRVAAQLTSNRLP